MRTLNIVRLKLLTNEYTPSELNSIIGIECDQSWLKGDMRGNTIIEEKCNGWVLNSHLNGSDDLDSHLNAMLSSVREVEDIISSLSPKVNALFSCVVYADSMPALYFEKDVIRRISGLNADFDIDVYVVNVLPDL